MTQNPIPTVIALAIRKRFDLMFHDLRLAENTINRLDSQKCRAILDALARAERELGIADAHLRHYVPDHVLFARHETWLARMRRLWMRKP